MVIFCFQIKQEETKPKKKKIISLENNLEPGNYVVNFELETKEILCPECGEICKITINDFKISLCDCKIIIK